MDGSGVDAMFADDDAAGGSGLDDDGGFIGGGFHTGGAFDADDQYGMGLDTDDIGLDMHDHSQIRSSPSHGRPVSFVQQALRADLEAVRVCLHS